jgi:hypothetical protein
MNESDVPNPNTELITDPKVDIRYTNGNLKGRFNIKFKQHIFNWVIATLVSGCGAHGVYLHYHEQDLEKTITDQQKTISDSLVRESLAAERLQQLQLLITQRSTISPTLAVGIQDIPKPKQ